jgi:hypothetical protein
VHHRSNNLTVCECPACASRASHGNHGSWI